MSMVAFANAPYPRVARLFLKIAESITTGMLQITTPEGHRHIFRGEEEGPRATITLHHWGVVRRLLSRGDVGFALDYVDGNWETDDLPALLTLATLNADKLETFFHGKWWAQAVFLLRHVLRMNTRSGSRRNIMAHYDLGNDFYRLWLDETMTYSSALFNGNYQQSLASAQRAKYERILNRLNLREGQSLLEIGCGWGGLAETAMQYGAKVTGLTLSERQAEFARKRLADSARGQAEIRLQDYRDLKEQYDHIVSIEMFEAVGKKYWPVYFQKIRECLKPGGKAVIQTITIHEEVFQGYRYRSDFIQQFTFPGGMLPSSQRFLKEARRAGLRVNDVYAFGQDYAETLSRWLKDFDREIMQVKALGYDEEFIRLWRFYLSYCIAGFRSGRTDVIQVELSHDAL